jgi:hypothetical protein
VSCLNSLQDLDPRGTRLLQWAGAGGQEKSPSERPENGLECLLLPNLSVASLPLYLYSRFFASLILLFNVSTPTPYLIVLLCPGVRALEQRMRAFLGG